VDSRPIFNILFMWNDGDACIMCDDELFYANCTGDASSCSV